MSYCPKYTITAGMINLVAEISELTGRLHYSVENAQSLQLRKANRIKTVQGTVAIEQNSLSEAQVTALLNGKTVLAPPDDILAVRNAYKAYERLDTYEPYSTDSLTDAHGIMMAGLIDDAGQFRTTQAAVADSQGNIIHIGTLPRDVPGVMEDIMAWASTEMLHPLIKSCIIHFEIENIHPFSDGNGRMGRLWHTLLLSRWNSLFAWLPVESIVHSRQSEYYKAINESDMANDSSTFIEFMLQAVLDALKEAEENQ